MAVAEVQTHYDVSDAPVLSAFLQSDALVRVLMGPLGSGKTSACLVAEITRRAYGQKPGPDGIRRTRGVIVRNTRQQLEDTTAKTFQEWLPPNIAPLKKSGFTATLNWPNKGIHCELLFRALDKPGDVKRLLSLEVTWAYINEVREIPRHVFDMLQGRTGRYPSMKDGGCTWKGLWCDTNPWPIGHWGWELFQKNKPPPGFELYCQPSGLSEEAENLRHLTGGRKYYEDLMLGKDEDFIDCYIRGLCPKSDVGSYFGALLAQRELLGGISDFNHKRTGVFTFWDLGIDDSTAIWAARFRDEPGAPILAPTSNYAGTIRRAPEFIHHYESHGHAMQWYFDKVKEWERDFGFQYMKHCLPHDAMSRTLQTGQSIFDMCVQEWGAGKVAVVPALDKQDQIQAARWLLGQPIRIHSRCKEKADADDTDGIECLRAYHKSWDERLQVFSTKPVHDWSSHTADGFMTGAVFIRIAEQQTRPEEPPKPIKVKSWNDFTLNELWEIDAEERRARGRSGRLP